ncbi:MAG: NAD(P)/FAD-dependent oxidoreductase [Desulforhopalus sp.]
MQYDAVIIGAGVAGLACAKVFEQNKLSYLLLEAGNQPGGRVRTDMVDGFQLDHGFQVLQTGYPDVTQYLQLEELQLQKFPAGVAVRFNGRFHIIADPRYHPRHLLSTIGSHIGSFGDRLAMLKLAYHVCRRPFEELFNDPEEKTIDYLKRCGFSNRYIRSFFVPFFAGACLDKNINASSRVLQYIFRLFATGDAALPSGGMAEIPLHIAKSLTKDTIQFNSKAVQVKDGAVTLEDGRLIQGRHIVVATPEPVLQDLLQIKTRNRSVGESCLYYSTDWTPPFKKPFLLLNGDGRGPVNNIAFPSLVARGYAPAGKTLIAVVVVDDDWRKNADLDGEVRKQCTEWFGKAVTGWEHIRTYRLEHALPDQSPPTHNPYHLPQPFSENIRICGEYQSLPGLQWSLMSGHMTGKCLVETIKG